ncbi:phosphatidylinositol-glycan biosynthesis class W protein-like [Coccinella septempunctata]|uniref:phosphatidylinositol-glycan biosynthesis class W protein-like n=1 Tax=Coccinella septempunctata TaxID=41139 RepID=UPI001D092A71|nr:phosphatidylinositol-glycan biosynthesis class W protein-like [Coccinella septempunctata]
MSQDLNDFMKSEGTTSIETLSLIIPSILGVYISTTSATILQSEKKWQFALEFITLLLPMVLTITILSSYIYAVITISFILCLSLFYLAQQQPPQAVHKFEGIEDKRIPFITNARATINILSVIAILAVDFPVFPRRFAKTSTYGFSLMDLGVGLYIFANSIVSPECLNRKDSIAKIVKSCIPLMILGLLRLVFTKSLDYHVPVSEYGVHWNFFFTLLLTKCISSLTVRTAHVKHMRTFSIIILISHELLLQFFLQDIVMGNEPRTNFFLANKEGISSILGYVSLYIYAVYYGHILNEEVYGFTKVYANIKMFISHLIITGTLAFICNMKLGTSRRLINSSYCFWVVFVGILAAFLFYLGELLQRFAFAKNKNYIKSPYIYKAINSNALIFFLLGNIFTGTINFVCNARDVSDPLALFILVMYIFILALIMCGLHEKKFKLKLS